MCLQVEGVCTSIGSGNVVSICICTSTAIPNKLASCLSPILRFTYLFYPNLSATMCLVAGKLGHVSVPQASSVSGNGKKVKILKG